MFTKTLINALCRSTHGRNPLWLILVMTIVIVRAAQTKDDLKRMIHERYVALGSGDVGMLGDALTHIIMTQVLGKGLPLDQHEAIMKHCQAGFHELEASIVCPADHTKLEALPADHKKLEADHKKLNKIIKHFDKRGIEQSTREVGKFNDAWELCTRIGANDLKHKLMATLRWRLFDERHNTRRIQKGDLVIHKDKGSRDMFGIGEVRRAKVGRDAFVYFGKLRQEVETPPRTLRVRSPVLSTFRQLLRSSNCEFKKELKVIAEKFGCIFDVPIGCFFESVIKDHANLFNPKFILNAIKVMMLKGELKGLEARRLNQYLLESIRQMACKDFNMLVQTAVANLKNSEFRDPDAVPDHRAHRSKSKRRSKRKVPKPSKSMGAKDPRSKRRSGGKRKSEEKSLQPNKKGRSGGRVGEIQRELEKQQANHTGWNKGVPALGLGNNLTRKGGKTKEAAAELSVFGATHSDLFQRQKKNTSG